MITPMLAISIKESGPPGQAFDLLCTRHELIAGRSHANTGPAEHDEDSYPLLFAREVGAECCDTQNLDASPIHHNAANRSGWSNN